MFRHNFNKNFENFGDHSFALLFQSEYAEFSHVSRVYSITIECIEPGAITWVGTDPNATFNYEYLENWKL